METGRLKGLRSRVIRVAALAACLCTAAIGQEAASEPPLRIGVSGDYPNGIDGQLSARGLPWQRVFAWELNRPEALAQYDVLMLSCIPKETRGVEDALTPWLEAGGRAYVETWAAQSRYPLLNLVKVASGAPSTGDVVMTAPEHPLAAGLSVALPIDMHHLQGVRVWPKQDGVGAILAHYCTDGGGQAIEKAPAIVSVPVGEGELLYSGAPTAFARFHRGRSAEPLMDAIINYLLGDLAVPRLLYTEPLSTAPPTSGGRIVVEEETPAEPEPAVEPPPPPPDPGAIPEGLELVECLADEIYTVVAKVGEVAGGDPTVLGLDALYNAQGKPTKPALWLTLHGDRVELRNGKTTRGKTIATGEWQPKEGAEARVKRRPGLVSVLQGGDEVLRASVKAKPGGTVVVHQGAAPLVDPFVQPLAPVVFGDDFMRHEKAPTPWTHVSGDWKNVGVGNEHFSINGFYYLGKSDTPGLATIGEWFWDEYAYGAAVRPNSEGVSVGLCALVQENGDYIAFTAGPATYRLARRLGGEDIALAEADGGLAHGQWYRLTIRLTNGRVEGLVDGEVVVSAENPEPRGGGIGLLVAGGAARFDDVLVHPASEPLRSPRCEGCPAAEIPDSMGPHDYMTWANAAGPWVAVPERPSLLWHTGAYFGDVDFTMMLRATDRPSVRRLVLTETSESPDGEWLWAEVRLEPGESRGELLVGGPGRKPASRRVALTGEDRLSLSRADGVATVLWNGRPAAKLGKAEGLRQLGLQISGAPVQAEDVAAVSPNVRDYSFGVAPTDWWASGGSWEVSARWACDNRWSWLAGWDSQDAVIWNKRPVNGDVLLDLWIGVKMEAPGGPETTRCRDLNAVLCGDKVSATSGYSFTLGGDSGAKTQLLRNGEVVAENAEVRVPAGYNIHHRWFHVVASRSGNEIALDFEGRKVLRYEDPDPLPGGYVGMWTRNSGVLIPRAVVYGSSERR